jgi:phosphomannomutase/phosphoglucomutase
MSFPRPQVDLAPNTVAYETVPFIKPTGFREYDARWLFEKDINLMGIQAVGLGMATLFRRRDVPVRLVTGHDFRDYSSSIKAALVNGLLAGGAEVFDVGLALSPMAYFAQFELDVEGVAMVTASHNDNGWTGIKMGMHRPLTFGPDEMRALKDIVMAGDFDMPGGGMYHYRPEILEKYKVDLISSTQLKRALKVVCACGNGTAGAFAPQVLEGVGCQVVRLNCDLDHQFPHHNPNPEDMKMLGALSAAVLEHEADLGFAFDGDGDRCGVVDNKGEAIFADKVGVLLARDLSARHPSAHFVADVKSTGLFMTDPVLQKNGAITSYWKTGHSYIKSYCYEHECLAGFEKSGHFFFNTPEGRGYDDALVTALAVCSMLENNPEQSMADLRESLPQTFQSPTMAVHCADEEKYAVVDRAVEYFGKKIALAGQEVKETVTVNGIRIVLADGTWGLVRASSNKPELVVVVESPTSEASKRAIFEEIDAFLSAQPEVGEYNQKI